MQPDYTCNCIKSTSERVQCLFYDGRELAVAHVPLTRGSPETI